MVIAHKKQDAFNYYMQESNASQKNASMRDTLDQLAALEQKLSDEQTAKALDTYNTARTMMLAWASPPSWWRSSPPCS